MIQELKAKVKDHFKIAKSTLYRLWDAWQAHRDTLNEDEIKKENTNIASCIFGILFMICALHTFYVRVQYDRIGGNTSPPSVDKDTQFWRDMTKELKRDKLNPFQK